MADLITVEGPGGGGKTTLGKKIAQQKGYEFIDLDSYLDEGCDYYIGPFSQAYKIMNDSLKDGKSVVVAFWSFEKAGYVQNYVPYIERLVDKYNCNRVQFMLNTSLEKSLEGNRNRKKQLLEEDIVDVWNRINDSDMSKHIMIKNDDYKKAEFQMLNYFN